MHSSGDHTDKRTFGYDSHGRLTSVRQSFDGGSEVTLWTGTYDGNLITDPDKGASYRWDVNNLSRVWVALMMAMFLAVSSCGLPYCKKEPFSDNDLDWMKPYSVGDTLIFANNENVEFDTLIVTKKTIDNPSNKNIFDLRGCNWMEGDNEYKANAEYQFDAYHSGERYKCLFILEKNCNSEPAVLSLGLFGRYTKNYISTGNIVKDSSIFPQYKWNIVVLDSNLHSGIHQPVLPVTCIYWNRDVGLIGYKTSQLWYKLIKISSC